MVIPIVGVGGVSSDDLLLEEEEADLSIAVIVVCHSGGKSFRCSIGDLDSLPNLV